jgi:hypothetical protein
MSDQEWLDNLQPGDKVAVVYGMRGESFSVHTIERITAKRTFVLASTNERFNARGWLMGNYDRWNRRYLTDPVPLLEKNQAKLAYQVAYDRIKTFPFMHLQTDTLMQIGDYLDQFLDEEGNLLESVVRAR